MSIKKRYKQTEDHIHKRVESNKKNGLYIRSKELMIKNNPMKKLEIREKVGTTRRKHIKEGKIIIMNGNKNPMWNKHHSEESKKRISDNHASKKPGYINPKPMLGKHHSEITKGKMNKARIGNPTYQDPIRNKKISEKALLRFVNPENHPSWKGGIADNPYPVAFNKQFKEAIRARDGYACKLCMIFEDDNIKLYHKKLSIHHINYDKTLTIKENAITLCNRCNSIVNKDRELWTKHFQDMLKRDYGYQYTEEQKVLIDFIKLQSSED